MSLAPAPGTDVVHPFEHTSVIAELLQRLDAQEGTEMASCYIGGVSALLRYFAGVDGETSLPERRFLATAGIDADGDDNSKQVPSSR